MWGLGSILGSPSWHWQMILCGLSLLLSTLLSLPALRSVASRPTTWSARACYHDADGTSRDDDDDDDDAKDFNTTKRRIAVLLVAALGWSFTAVLLIIDPPAHASTSQDAARWLTLATWTILLLQAFAIATEETPPVAAELGERIAFCSFLVAVVAAGIIDTAALPSTLTLQVSSIWAALGITLASLCIPRRPDVFHKGRLVDRAATHSVITRWTWSWANDLLARARVAGVLRMEDLPRPGHRMRMFECMQGWPGPSHVNESLAYLLLRTYRCMFAAQWAGAIACALISIAPQWTVLHFLRLMEETSFEISDPRAWTWICALGLAMLGQTWLEAYVSWISHSRLALPIRAQLSSLIFRKCLRMEENHSLCSNTEATAQTDDDPPGQSTINLIGVDAKRVADFCQSNSIIWQSLIKLIVALLFLASLIGWKSLLVGFAASSLLLPVNFLFSKRQNTIQKTLMDTREVKTAVVTQTLKGIRQIKLAAHEFQWQAKIGGIRDHELRLVWAAYLNNLLLTACWISSPILFAAVTLCTYAILYRDLTPSVAFVSLAVFSSLEVTLSSIPGTVTAMLDAAVSAQRIDLYLRAAETTDTVVQTTENVTLANVSIAPPNATQAAPSSAVLEDLNITFPIGALSVITGGTGSGKSLLLKAILGEAGIVRGTINRPPQQRHKMTWVVPGTTAYVAQTPWLENNTIRDNILFGLPFHHRRYLDTLWACALVTDIEGLPDKDLTLVGGGGTKLSGGQRWRVTLARALYSRAEILILDDIFSAVDPHVGRHILDHGLVGELSIGRTRILATHHARLCEEEASISVVLGDRKATVAERIVQEPTIGVETVETMSYEASECSTEYEDTTAMVLPDALSSSHTLEHMEQGAVKGRVYAAFFVAGGGYKLWFGIGLLFLLTQIIIVGQSWWLKLWTSDQNASAKGLVRLEQQPMLAHHYNSLGHSGTRLDTETYLAIYVLLAFGSAFFSMVQQYFVLLGSIKAAKSLFSTLLSVILHTPISWLDEVPVGRLLNRLTSDFYTIESEMPYAMMYLATAVLNLLSTVAVGIWASPIIIVVGALCMGLSAWLTTAYLQVARSLKRLESVTRSPIYDQFSSALLGISTIRGFGKCEEFVARMDDKIDDSTTASYFLLMFNEWIALRIGAVGAGFAVAVAAMIVLKESADAALAGFIMASTLQLSGHIMAAIQRFTTTELEMNAAERIVEYCEVQTERTAGLLPPATWPSAGQVGFHHLVVKYGESPAVLKGITFDVSPCERIGIVGRTGAGKSSLAMALFRMTEATSGRICIDGVDISQLDLAALRSRMAIVQQEPVLFAGTIRSNLDPFNVHDDAELYAALRQVQVSGELHDPVLEGGNNLSQGQRQLLCLARLIVQPAKVVVLDEATSGIDMGTDQQLQRALRACITNSTLLVIAHRLSTVADFDRLVVLDRGRVAEMGSPQQLWQQGTYFRAMCEESGERQKLEELFSSQQN